MNRGTIPMDVVLRDCKAIHAELMAMADGRSIVYRPGIVFKRYKHWRTYWGYFRDAYWMARCDDKGWSIERHPAITDEIIQRVRAKRSKHRRNAELRRYIHKGAA